VLSQIYPGAYNCPGEINVEATRRSIAGRFLARTLFCISRTNTQAFLPMPTILVTFAPFRSKRETTALRYKS